MKMTKAQIEMLEKAELILTRLHFDIEECTNGKKLYKKLDKILAELLTRKYEGGDNANS